MRPFPLSPGHSLRGQLLWLLSVAIVLAAAAQTVLVYHMTRSEADEVFDFQMQQVALTLQGGAEPAAMAPGNSHQEENEHFDFVIQVRTPGGERLFQSAEDAALPATTTPGFSRAKVRGGHCRVFTARTPTRIIKVAQDIEVREHMAAAMALRTVAPILLLAPLLIAAVWLVVRRSTRPILRVKQQVANRVVEDLSPLRSADLPEEVKPLVEEINLLFTRLDRAFAAQRDFVADAAHELRTPLAALRLQGQGLQRAGTEEARSLATQRLLGGVDRATRLVEQMLVLARQEATQDPLRAGGVVDLGAVSSLAISDSLPWAQRKRIDLGMEAEAGVQVLGQEEILRILVRNLIENALKFTPDGGTVDVVIRAEAGRAVWAVGDSGPGIPPGERVRVFDRFYRLPGQVEPGNGLGLAIVKTIAERHQGTVTLDRSARLGGLEVRIVLPLAPSH